MFTASSCQVEGAVMQCLANLPRLFNQPLKIAIALSGGLDSMVLLDAVTRCINMPRQSMPIISGVYALHIHHGLSMQADQWQLFCQQQATQRAVSFVTECIHLAASPEGGVEQAARQARYAALHALCHSHDIDLLLTAHHQDDQAETVLLQLLRGAGVHGLAAMPVAASLVTQRALLYRPFLSLSRQQLADYAAQHQVTYVDDESNHNQDYARNAIRHDIMPRLQKIRSGCSKSLARSAALLAEAAALLDEMAQADLNLASLATEPNSLAIEQKHDNSSVVGIFSAAHLRPIPCALLMQLGAPRARNVLRYWLTSQGLRAPSAAHLSEMLKQFACVNDNTRASLQHDGRTVSVWRHHLWLEPIKPTTKPSEISFMWQGQSEWPLPQWGGTLHLYPARSGQMGVARQVLLAQPIQIKARSGGERFRSHWQRSSRSLQHAYQEQNVPPWMRAGPLFYAGEQLIFVAHLGLHCSAAIADGVCLDDAVCLAWHNDIL